MALKLTNYTLDNGLTASNVYVRVTEFAPRKIVAKDSEGAWAYESSTRIWCDFFLFDGTNAPALGTKPFKSYEVFSVDYILTGTADTPDNVFKLAYTALKTLTEFSGATDI